MTLGEKIKKYRLLQNKTQKQLGEEVGFKKNTADVRINQYESDKMAPKSDIRNAIANSLDIDIEAISDISITSYVDLMYIFFELEEELGMTIEKKDGKTALIFNDSDNNIATLISYLNLWKNQKETLISDPETASEQQKRDYKLWKSRFHKNVTEYYKHKEMAINDYYKATITSISKNLTYAKKTSEITLLLRKIVESGLSLSTKSMSLDLGVTAQGFTFTVNELLNPPTQTSKHLFAQFLSEIKHFDDLGAKCFTDMQMLDKVLTITYYIPISSFSVIQSQIMKFLEFNSNKEQHTDYAVDAFEKSFAYNLKTYYNYIEDEIQHYC